MVTHKTVSFVTIVKDMKEEEQDDANATLLPTTNIQIMNVSVKLLIRSTRHYIKAMSMHKLVEKECLLTSSG